MLPFSSREHHRRAVWICLASFLLCILLIWPYLESGLTDDWSTVRTAQLLAETGHIHYNGWEAAILGWPLYIAALFIKLFGPSFTSIRASDLLEAIATVVLLFRIFRRVGLNEWNSAFGTLAVALSPMFLLASVVFMTDIPGMLAFLVCLYGCLRAVQAQQERASAGWLVFAASSNAVLGTSRQIAWLGVLIMVPCALWLLRRQRIVVVSGVLSCLLSYAFIAGCMHWFAHQPYILVAPLLPPELQAVGKRKLLDVTSRIGLDLILFTLPASIAFLPALRRATRRTWWTLSVVAIVLLGAELFLHQVGVNKAWLAPWLIFPYVHPHTLENTFTMTSLPMKGPAPAPLTFGLRLPATALTLTGVAGLVSAFTARRNFIRDREMTLKVPWNQLLWLLLPTSAAYIAFLVSRAAYNFAYDRYLLPVLPFALLLLLAYFQTRERQRVPAACGILIFLSALYSVFTLHDAFASYRAALAACNEVLAAGYPRTAVDGGWEFNHYTQILVGTYVHQPGVRMPDGTLLPNLDSNTPTACSMDVREWTPDVHPQFALAYPGSPCPREASFAPVYFHTWLPPYKRQVNIVRYSTQGRIEPQVPTQ